MNEINKREQKADERDQIKKSILAQLKQSKLREEGSIGEDNEDEDSFDNDLSQDEALVIEH